MNDTNPKFTILTTPFDTPFSICHKLALAWFSTTNPNDTPQPVYVIARRK